MQLTMTFEKIAQIENSRQISSPSKKKNPILCNDVLDACQNTLLDHSLSELYANIQVVETREGH